MPLVVFMDCNVLCFLDGHDALLAIETQGEAASIGRDQCVGLAEGRLGSSLAGTPAHGIAQAMAAEHKGGTLGGAEFESRSNLFGTTCLIELLGAAIGDIGQVG